jgi:hypothetical protein
MSIGVSAQARGVPQEAVGSSVQGSSQSTSQDAAPPSSSSPSAASQPPPRWSGTTEKNAQAYRAVNRPQYVRYFSLEHRSAAQMNPEDRDLLQSRSRELSIAAEIFGYDISAGNWTVDQTICPVFPNTLMLHYLSKYPDGSESLFTALVPRGRGRVRVVPSLHRNAATYLPAVKDPRNYALFNELVPAEMARRDSGPEGKWLILGVCYAEMVGARPNVPDDPGLDIAMVHAPVSTFRVDTVEKTRQIQFPDREGSNVYTIWTIALSKAGRITGATDEDYSTFVAHVVKLQEPVGKVKPNPPEPTGKIISPTDQPKIKVTNPPEIPQG